MDICAFKHEHPGTRRCTIHPYTLTPTLTKQQNHVNSYKSGSVSKLFVSSFAHQWMRSIESLLVNKGMGRGSSWSSLDLETLESDVSSGRSAGAIAKDRGWPSSSVRQLVAAIKRGDPSPQPLTQTLVAGSASPELLDEIREFIEEEHVRISLKIVSNRFALSRTCSRKAIRCLCLRPLVIRTVPHLETVTSVIVASSRRRCWRGWRLHLEGVSRGRSQRIDA